MGQTLGGADRCLATCSRICSDTPTRLGVAVPDTEFLTEILEFHTAQRFGKCHKSSLLTIQQSLIALLIGLLMLVVVESSQDLLKKFHEVDKFGRQAQSYARYIYISGETPNSGLTPCTRSCAGLLSC